jgi:two-component system, OmpR family, alkaline phosphatase synthesis response regulator PhoP
MNICILEQCRVLVNVVNKKSVLIVDDDRYILQTFRRILERCGYEVETAESGSEAISKASNRHYDAALLDLRLPDMKGTDILIRAKQQLKSTAKIMITGFPSLESGVVALEEGADAYLTKPVQPRELLAVMDDKLGHINCSIL